MDTQSVGTYASQTCGTAVMPHTLQTEDALTGKVKVFEPSITNQLRLRKICFKTESEWRRKKKEFYSRFPVYVLLDPPCWLVRIAMSGDMSGFAVLVCVVTFGPGVDTVACSDDGGEEGDG